MTSHVAVAHYPEGAGHATRMMAVARGLAERGATVSLCGGGPGRRFYEPNGFTAHEVPAVDYITDFQGADGPVEGLARVLTTSLPDSVRRVGALADWLRAEAPDAVITDDMFAAMAAVRTRTPLYVLTHNSAGLYRDPLVRVATRGVNLGQQVAALRFFYPTLWPPHPGDPSGISRVPPIALTAPAGATEAGPTDPGVVVVPSAYSTGFDGLVERIREAGHGVTHVGGPDWESVPALLPVLERADAVVCAGYSTIMEAAVAGTPCIVLPSTNEQRGVGRRLRDVEGFAVVDGPDAVEAALAHPPDAPSYPNGVATVSERLLDDVRRRSGDATDEH